MPGKLIIFSAPSGAGKTTIVQHLIKKFPQLEFSVSACNRPMRPDEVEGKDYYFLGTEEFKKRIQNKEFVEWEEVYPDQFYGTLRSEIERIWADGKQAIFDIDVQGGLHLKEQFGDQALAVFVMPPSVEALRKRLKERATETPESIARRINKAEHEIEAANLFDRIILNDELNTAFKKAEKIIGDFLDK